MLSKVWARDMITGVFLLICMSVLTGIVYPLLVTVCAQYTFPWKANGSMLYQQERIIGSAILGQSFTSARYFWGRPSATHGYPYNSLSSSASQAGPMDKDFLAAVRLRVEHLRKDIPASFYQRIPGDLVTTSASGLDPDISLDAARYQVFRIAKIRHMTRAQLYALIDHNTIKRTWGVLGEPRINVLALNMALDALAKEHHD